MKEDFNQRFIADISKDIDFKKYLDFMAEIKYRMVELSKRCEMFFIINKTVDDILFESICLQTRKILELIAMSSLVCNKEAFDEVNKNISSLWNGKEIILEVKKYNPLVFPITSYKYKKFNPKELYKYYQDLKPVKDVLNEGKFIEIYEKCGGMLHIKNPYNTKHDIKKEIIEKFPQWLDIIFNTMAIHTVCPYGFEFKRYFVYLGDFSDLEVFGTQLIIM